MRCEYCGSDLVEVDNPMRREFRHRRGVVCSGRPVPEFREPAGDLNTATDVQESPAPSTTDRLAETAPLSDEYLERIRSNAETWRETHDVLPEELMDIDVLLAEVDRARAQEQALLTHNGVLVTEVRFQAERADDQKGIAASLRARLDTAEGRVLAEITAEQAAQTAKFGEQNHPDGTGDYAEIIDADVCRQACQDAAADGRLDWLHVLREEVAEAFAESDPAALRTELIQVAAVAVTWVEAIDRRGSGVSR